MQHEAQKNNSHAILIALLVLNAILLVYIGFIKKDAVWLETMKVGWTTNFDLVQQLYNSDMYKNQQTQAIQQVLGSLNQPAVQPTAEATTEATAQPEANGEVQPAAEATAPTAPAAK